MKNSWVGSVCVAVCIAALAPTAQAASPDVRHDLEVLPQYSEASLLLCSMQTKAAFLKQLEGGGSDTESESWRCAKKQEGEIGSYLSQARKDLEEKPKAIALLKDWYSAGSPRLKTCLPTEVR